MVRIALVLLVAAALAGCASPASRTSRAPLFNDDGSVRRDPANGAPLYDR